MTDAPNHAKVTRHHDACPVGGPPEDCQWCRDYSSERQNHAKLYDGSYGPGRGAAMSERISFTYDELRLLWHFIGEAHESGNEESDEEAALAERLNEKVRRAFAKAERKRNA